MNVAFIPVRGGSKSIPLKNIKEIAGHPLVYWTVKAACECENIDIVYVSTDSMVIKDTVNGFKSGNEADLFGKVQVIGRSDESASDTASTEFAMLEFAANYDFDNITLVQATSPLLTGEDLRKGFALFSRADVDSVLSVVRQKRFIWNDVDGYVAPQNYDYMNRPRRQEFDGYLVENGAFYITSKNDLMKSQNRMSGKICAVEMDEASYFEIDEPSDFIIIESLLKNRESKAHKKDIPRIRMFLTDCDGVLTDGGMYYSENGDELKKFNTKDGYGLAQLRERGIITGIITGEDRELNRRRAKKLGLDEIISGAKDKIGEIKKLCEKYDVPMECVAYIGDDCNDLEAIKQVGLGCCPSDANSGVIAAADYVTKCKGGSGAVREVVDHLIENGCI